ncbi:MAG: hypothetical protein M3313_12130, partial [Actinomycetota bacterium]|nr:hypothetical protein [Actinomycetota bacterium]
MAEQVPWVELRIHGVSGTPPEDMLGSPHVRQVAGDEFSRFFRAVDAQQQEVRPAPDHILEGYHWGKFTSGSWRQGLWLAILPFGVVNAAQFMLPTPVRASKSAKLWHAVCGAMLRLLGLGLTAMLLLGVAVVAMDLTAWQWGPQQNLPTWSAFPGWPLAAAMLVCAAVVGLLFSFGRRLGGANQNAGRQDGLAPGGQSVASDLPQTELRFRRFFTGDTDAPALRKLHLATGFALVAALGAAAGRPFTDGGAAVQWTFWVSVALAGVLAVIVVLLGDPEETVTVSTTGWTASLRSWWHGVVSPVSTALVVASFLALVVSLFLAGRRPLPGGDLVTALPGIDGAAFVVLVACVTGLLVLFLANALLAAATRVSGDLAPPPPFARFALGITSSLAASVGTFLAVGYAAALPFGWAWLLGRGDGPNYQISPLLQRIAYAWGLTFLLVAGFLVAAAISYLVRRAEFLDRAKAAFSFGGRPLPGPGVEEGQTWRLPSSWIGRVARAMWMARLKNAIQLVFWVFAIFGVLLSLAAGTEFVSSSPTDPFNLPGPLGSLSEDTSSAGAEVVIALGTVVLIGLAVGLVFLGRGALRKETLRRGVNVAWDVIAFWPRAVHPFVPPPYSQRAVADLHDRICWHLDHPVPMVDGRTGLHVPRAKHVVVAAHSQGSLIAIAALLWLTDDQRERVGLVTFGSQLRVAFPRAFPAYVDYRVLEWLYQQLGGRWVSLYRDTDAIAGPVLSWRHSRDASGAAPESHRILQTDRSSPDEIDLTWGRRVCGPEWRLLDPTPYDVALQHGAVFKISAHSNYPDDPAWPAALAAVAPREAAGVTPPDAASDPPVPSPPDPASGPTSSGRHLDHTAARPATTHPAT